MVEVILQYQNQVKFFIQIFFLLYSFLFSDDSYQQPVQLNINEPVRFSAVQPPSPTQYLKKISKIFFLL
jgi:hypothetical protein